MRTLTFNTHCGNFYLDQHEDIGEYIEVADVRYVRSKRTSGRSCFIFYLILQFSCNMCNAEYVEFYTFKKYIAEIFKTLGGKEGNYCLKPTKAIGETTFKLIAKELVL